MYAYGNDYCQLWLKLMRARFATTLPQTAAVKYAPRTSTIQVCLFYVLFFVVIAVRYLLIFTLATRVRYTNY